MVSMIIKNLNFGYKNTKAIFNNFSCEVQNKRAIYLDGISGAGKTTLFKILAGFLKAKYDYIQINSQLITPNLQPHQRNLAMVFQHTGLWLNMSVEKNISLVANQKVVPQDIYQSWISDLIAPDLLHKKCFALSAGEQQRVEIIRALVAGKQILLLDEPFAFQDQANVEKLARIISQYYTLTNCTLIFTTHSPTSHKFLPSFSTLDINTGISL